jgi:hypothetical protein
MIIYFLMIGIGAAIVFISDIIRLYVGKTILTMSLVQFGGILILISALRCPWWNSKSIWPWLISFGISFVVIELSVRLHWRIKMGRWKP